METNRNRNKNQILIRKDKTLIKRANKNTRKAITIKTHYKKLMLKRFFMGYYLIKRLHQLRNIVNISRKLFGNKIINFYFYLESRVIPTCLRMCFFWNKRRGLN